MYAAFTRKDKPFFYDKVANFFYALNGQEASESCESRVPIPTATQEQLVADRQLFADTLAEPLKGSASAVLHDDRPLTEFKKVLIAHRMFEQWIGFHNQLLVPRVRAWAEINNVPVSDTWFKSSPKSDAFRNAVIKIIGAMSDDDLGEVNIPLKYIRLLLPR